MRKTLLGMFHELKESGSSSDYPYLLANTMHKALLNKFRGVISPWQQYTLKGDMADFKTHDRIILGEAPDLLPVQEDGEYIDSKIGESRYQIALETVGRKWTVTRKAIINDDLRGLLQFPERYGRSAARTIAKAVTAVLESNAAAYDGTALFAARGSWNNDGHVRISANLAGISALDTAISTIKTSKDPHSGEIMGIGQTLYLIVSPTLEMTANWLRTSTQVRGGSTGTLVDNPVAGKFQVLVEPFLTTYPGRSYLCVAPEEAHFAEVGFLNGKVEPDLLARAATSIRVNGGGEDPYGFDIDDMEFKVRHDWKVAAGFYQGVYKLGD